MWYHLDLDTGYLYRSILYWAEHNFPQTSCGWKSLQNSWYDILFFLTENSYILWYLYAVNTFAFRHMLKGLFVYFNISWPTITNAVIISWHKEVCSIWSAEDYKHHTNTNKTWCPRGKIDHNILYWLLFLDAHYCQ